MDTASLESSFAKIGARVRFTVPESRWSRWNPDFQLALDVRTDHKGEYFEVRTAPRTDPDIIPVDVRPTERHLLLMLRQDGTRSKFLCGHDERHWFVAAIPEATRGVGTVRTAMDALKPAAVQTAEVRAGVSGAKRYRRKNSAFIRQGEWFFLPVPTMEVDPKLVLRDEPLRRGGGKPHIMEFCYRTGGETVYVCRQRPNGLTGPEQKALFAREPSAVRWSWRTMQRNPSVFVRGRVRHSDHATITLPGWHQVVMNTEGQAAAMRNVAFLD